MENILYIKIHQKGRSNCPSENQKPPAKQVISQHRNVFVKKHCPVPTLATCWELVFAISCSLLCSTYALNHEGQTNALSTDDLQLPRTGSEYFDWILDPSPSVMLGACILLGCAVSSFAYRRQEHDNYQTLIFILYITSGTAFGAWLGVTANVIMLGLIPWALCMAMISSVAVHWIVRRCTHEFGVQVYCCEVKGRKQIISQC